MTKEAIREKHLNKNGLSVNNSKVGQAIQKSAFDAMDEFAKQQSIEFFKWNTKEVIRLVRLDIGKEHAGQASAFQELSIEERYNIFLQYQSNKEVT